MKQFHRNSVRAAGKIKTENEREGIPFKIDDFVSKIERLWLYVTAVLLIVLSFVLVLLSLSGIRSDEHQPDIPLEVVDICISKPHYQKCYTDLGFGICDWGLL